MQKKLMVVAVASALGTIGTTAAYAQGSSVQIYGTIATALEGAQAKGADTSVSGQSSLRGLSAGTPFNTVGSAYTATPAQRDFRMRVISSGSNFGIRGREDLGSGLYAGFQAEAAITLGGTSAQTSGTGGTVATWRNTGLWIGGNQWGEVGWGMWDTPYNINMGLAPAHAAYASASTTMVAGILGILPTPGAGTISGYTVDAQCNPGAVVIGSTGTVNTSTLTFGNSAATCFNWGTSFHRRVSNSFWYQSPSWAGFRLRLHYGAPGNQTTPTTGSGQLGTPSKLNPSLYGASASYTLGGFYGGIGWEQHKDYLAGAARYFSASGLNGLTLGGQVIVPGLFNTTAAIPGNIVSGSTDNAYNVNLRYTFAFGLSIGGYWEKLKYSADYAVFQAGTLTDLEKSSWRADVAYQIGPHTIGLQYGAANNLKGTTTAAQFDGSNTSGNVWILGYAYSLSKRTSLFGYYTRVSNQANAAYSGIVFYGVGPVAGADPRYGGIGLRHTF